MAGIRIEMDDRQVQDALARLVQAGRDPAPALNAIGEYLRLAHDDRFQQGISPDGDPWAPLSPAYAKRKNKNKDRILVLRGYLSGTLHHELEGNDTLLFGTNQPYGATHQLGSTKKNIPARPFLGVSAEDRERMLEILNDYLAGQPGAS